jgi:putative acetyltransferase
VRGDEGGIRAVHLASFPTGAEAGLVDALRATRRLTVSLVAVEGGRGLGRGGIVGHIGFSPVSAGGTGGGVGLAPLAVVPAYRRGGIGASLVREGLAACAAMGYRFVVVLGEPRYYGRFGFVPARSWGLRDPYGGGDAFQVLALQPGSPDDGREPRPGARAEGERLVRYAPEFDALPPA